MGASYSSDEDLDEQDVETKSIIVNDPKMSTPLSDIHSTVIRTSGVANTPAREEGDGMEKPPQASVRNSVNTERKTGLLDTLKHQDKVIELPEAGLKLDKLPPIHDIVDLPPVIPKTPLVAEKPKVYPKGSYPPTHKKNKEPRFVPYEPYKGAVASMEGKKGKDDNIYVAYSRCFITTIQLNFLRDNQFLFLLSTLWKMMSFLGMMKIFTNNPSR